MRNAYRIRKPRGKKPHDIVTIKFSRRPLHGKVLRESTALPNILINTD